MITWKAIITSTHPYRMMWKVIVKTDMKEIHERIEWGIEVDFCQNFLLGGNIPLTLSLFLNIPFLEMTQIPDRFNSSPFHRFKVTCVIYLMQSNVWIYAYHRLLCTRAAPAAVKDCNGLSITNKSKKGGQRFGSKARNWGMQTGLVGWLKKKAKGIGWN